MPARRSFRVTDTRRWAALVWAIVTRPGLWRTAVRQIGRTAAPGWWRRLPLLPIPPADYLAFRTTTQSGLDGVPSPRDVVNYLAWCKRWDREISSDR